VRHLRGKNLLHRHEARRNEVKGLMRDAGWEVKRWKRHRASGSKEGGGLKNNRSYIVAYVDSIENGRDTSLHNRAFHNCKKK